MSVDSTESNTRRWDFDGGKVGKERAMYKDGRGTDGTNAGDDNYKKLKVSPAATIEAWSRIVDRRRGRRRTTRGGGEIRLFGGPTALCWAPGANRESGVVGGTSVYVGMPSKRYVALSLSRSVPVSARTNTGEWQMHWRAELSGCLVDVCWMTRYLFSTVQLYSTLLPLQRRAIVFRRSRTRVALRLPSLGQFHIT